MFNFDVPHHADDYVHRIGRTGRAGRAGAAITIVAPDDRKAVAAIEKLTGQTIAWAGEPAEVRSEESAERARAKHRATAAARPRQGATAGAPAGSGRAQPAQRPAAQVARARTARRPRRPAAATRAEEGDEVRICRHSCLAGAAQGLKLSGEYMLR